MKKRIYTILAAAISLALCLLFGLALFAYTRPMEDAAYNLSMFYEGEAYPEDWVYDQKGWTVFTKEGSDATELSPDGYGGFTEISKPGQTFYFSRILKEDLDSPTLRLHTANRTFAVFLDDVLLYTDCPEQDNRIGYLNLPMLEWDREDPLIISLPLDYAGKTLTIAQSFDGYEKQSFDGTAYPCGITLYCGYTYESGLIAESFQTAIYATFAFTAGMTLLLLFVLKLFHDSFDLKLICGALLSFFLLINLITEVSFSKSYFALLPIDLNSLCRNLSLILLLVFLSGSLTKPHCILPWIFTAAQGAVLSVRLIMEATNRLSFDFEISAPIVGLAGLLISLACGFLERKNNWFFRLFCPLSAIGILLIGVFNILHPEWISFPYLLQSVMKLMTAEALILSIASAVRSEIARRMEQNLILQRSELAQQSYETMRRQHEEVMMLRHDMAKHLALLQKLVKEKQAAAYLNELIGENKKIRSVIQSGNHILDIILNARLADAAELGIELQIVSTNTPDTLPLSDKDMCALFVNIMDNAIAAAAAPGIEKPYIRLDMHMNDSFFVFVCQNSSTRTYVKQKSPLQRGRLNKHGLGMKIIRQIISRYGNLIETEHGTDYYTITIALPLEHI